MLKRLPDPGVAPVRDPAVAPPNVAAPNAAAPNRAADRAPARDASRQARIDLLIYAFLALATALTWRLSQAGLFRSGDDVGYWLGVAGGSMLLALFVYPLRKHVRLLQRLGKVKWWFLAHMALGVVGTFTILLHSTFHVRSTNAAVALYSMLIVSISGVIGRVLHVRVHRGLHGERSNLAQLQASAGLEGVAARSMLAFAPGVERRLREFDAHAGTGRRGLADAFGKVLILPVRQWSTAHRCRRELRRLLRERAKLHGWPPAKLRERERAAGDFVGRYLRAVVRVAQYAAYERLFALWHVAHVPFVYLFVATAVFHVIAVHAY
ncbi:MAG: hypothetical protein AB7P21_25560 [Lautropia sp.]